jgi:hypothetical protein
MAMNVCGNIECRLPGRMFGADRWEAYCSKACREAAHRRLLRVPCSVPAATGAEIRKRPAPARKTTMSTAAAWELLSERAADHPDVLAREVFPFETRRGR